MKMRERLWPGLGPWCAAVTGPCRFLCLSLPQSPPFYDEDRTASQASVGQTKHPAWSLMVTCCAQHAGVS